MFIQNGREAMVASKNVSVQQSWKYFITLRCMELKYLSQLCALIVKTGLYF